MTMFTLTRAPGLPGELKGELELARVVGRGWLACAAGRAGQGIAKLVDGGNVGAVEKVEGFGDEVDLEALAEGDAPGKAQIHLEKVRRCEGVAAEIPVAALGRRNVGHLERRAVGVETQGGRAEGHAGNES